MPTFPLRVSTDRRYLIDAIGAPFFIHADTAWRMPQRLTVAEARYYFDTRRAHGFNAVHGRMPSIATGANAANRNLHYIGVSGDGDTLSIGLGQFCHAIRRNIKLAEAPSFGKSIFDYAPTSAGANDYGLLAAEVVEMGE